MRIRGSLWRKAWSVRQTHLSCLAGWFLCWTCVCIFSPQANAQRTFTYQGQLFGAQGPVNAIYTLEFALYHEAEGGSALWEESHESVSVVDGIFLVELGNTSTLDTVIRSDAPLYLGISVGEHAEMTPRMLVGTALRAQWALHAKDVEGEDIHPRTLSVGGRLVIDEEGNWLGEALGERGPPGPAGPEGPRGPPGDAFDAARDTDLDGFPEGRRRCRGLPRAMISARLVPLHRDIPSP